MRKKLVKNLVLQLSIALLFATSFSHSSAFAYQEPDLNPFNQTKNAQLYQASQKASEQYNSINLNSNYANFAPQGQIQAPTNAYNAQLYVPYEKTKADENVYIVDNFQRVTNPVSHYGKTVGMTDLESEWGIYLSAGYINAKDANGNGLTSTVEDDLLAGNWIEKGNSLGKATGFELSIGAHTTNHLRVELSYKSLSGHSYADYAAQEGCYLTDDEVLDENGDPTGDYYEECDVYEFPKLKGGDITTNALMVNFYYSLERYTGSFLDGMITPYIGVGVGIAYNKIDDYILHDGNSYEYNPDGQFLTNENNFCTGQAGYNYCGYEQYDGEIFYEGSTTQNLAWMYELGLSIDFKNNFVFDVFYRYTNYGEVKTSGYAESDYLQDDIVTVKDEAGGTSTTCTSLGGTLSTDQASDGSLYCYIPLENSLSVYNDAEEAGVIETQEVGIKLRYFF